MEKTRFKLNICGVDVTVSGDVDGNDADLAAQEIDAASVPVAVPVIGGITAVFVVGLIVFLIYKNRKKSK